MIEVLAYEVSPTVPVGAEVAAESGLSRGHPKEDVPPVVDAVEAHSPPVNATSARKPMSGQRYPPPARGTL